MDKRQIW